MDPRRTDADAPRGGEADEPRREAGAIGGEGRCGHPPEAVEPLGLGGPLRFDRCSGCGAVVVTTVGG